MQMIRLTEKELIDELTEITKTILQNKYKIRLNNWSNHTTECIKEGLIYSYAPNKLVKILNNRFNLKSIGGTIFCSPRDSKALSINYSVLTSKTNKLVYDYEGLMEFHIVFHDGIKTDYNTIISVIDLMNACGWNFMCLSLKGDKFYKEINNTLINNLQNTPCHLKFEPKFSQTIPIEMLPPYLYHITPNRVVSRILSQGLTPRQKGRVVDHPERVYLFVYKPEDWHRIADRFRESGGMENYTLLMIDLEKLNQNIIFHQDTNTMAENPAIYTLEPIPPNAISVVEQENKKFNNDKNDGSI